MVIFWLWLLVALGVYGFRLWRRFTQGPKKSREQVDGAAATGAGTPPAPARGLSRLKGAPVAPLPEGPVEARLPKSLQGVPPPSGVIAEGAASATDAPPAVEGAPSPVAPAPPAHRLPVAEAVQGIAMPCDLLPLVDPDDPLLVGGHTARFSTTTATVRAVAAGLADELERLGYTVGGLDAVSAGTTTLLAERDGVAVTAEVSADDDTDAVVAELRT